MLRHCVLTVCAMLSIGVGSAAAAANSSLTNGSFETPDIFGPVMSFATFTSDIKAYLDADVPEWETNDVNDAIELWRDGAEDPGQIGFNFNAFSGNQFAEINAFSAGTLSVEVSPTVNATISFAFAHRGRFSDVVPDIIRVQATDLGPDGTLGGSDDTSLLSESFSAFRSGWEPHFVPLGTASGNSLLLEFTAVSTSSGNPGAGNFIDAVEFGEDSSIPQPIPTVSEWGLVVLMLSLLVGFKLKLGRRRS